MGRCGLRHLKFALSFALLTACFGDRAPAQSNEAALGAMERMQFSVKVGDGAEVVIKQVTLERGKPSTITIVMGYSITGVDQPAGAPSPTGYRVTLTVKTMAMDGVQTPAGFDDVIRAMFPPIELRTGADLDVLEIVNWPQIERQLKNAQQKLVFTNPGAVLSALFVTSTFSQKEMLLGLFTPIGEMQRKAWRSRDGGFDVAVTRRQGMSITGLAAPQEPVVAAGRQRLVPIEISNGKVRATTQTTYDTTQMETLVRRSPYGQKLGRDEGWTMKLTSTGEAEYNQQSGWIERMSETYRFEMQHARTKTTPRQESFELIQKRVPTMAP
jgi:hypothetical protein